MATAQPVQIAKGMSGGMDELGVLTVLVPWWVPTIEQTLTIGAFSFLGVPYRDRRFGVWDDDMTDAGFQVGVRYEGVPQDGPEVREVSWSFEGEFSEEKIETHPKLKILKEKYGGYIDENDNLKFPLEKPESAQESNYGFDFSQSDAEKDAPNPMFGQETYPLFQSVFNRTYTETRFPRELLDKIGKVTKSPPGVNLDGVGTLPGDPAAPGIVPDDLGDDGRDWMFMAPIIRGRGNVIEVTERYKMSPPGGWNPVMHEIVSL